MKVKLDAEHRNCQLLETNIRAEVCEEMKKQLVIIENNYQWVALFFYLSKAYL